MGRVNGLWFFCISLWGTVKNDGEPLVKPKNNGKAMEQQLQPFLTISYNEYMKKIKVSQKPILLHYSKVIPLEQMN